MDRDDMHAHRSNSSLTIKDLPSLRVGYAITSNYQSGGTDASMLDSSEALQISTLRNADMMPSLTRVLAVLLIAATSEFSAAESTTNARSVEISPGETVFFQLTNSLSFEIGPIARVDNPNRDYSLVKATFEVDGNGAAKLKLRNGYDETLSFQMYEACASPGTSGVMATLRPGVEAVWTIQAPTKTIVLCNFALMRAVSIEGNSWIQSTVDRLRNHNGDALPNR